MNLTRLPSRYLYELAALAETREQQTNPWRQLTPDAVTEAITMIAGGTPAALGWWRTHLPRRTVTPDWPTPIPHADPTRQWRPWELVAAAVDFTDEHTDINVAKAVLAQLAARHHLDHLALADAYIALEGR